MLSELNALGQVILVDLVLAGDNAIAVGLIASGVAASQRKFVIVAGVAAAVVLRIIFALLIVWLLKIPGVLLFGGLILFWVCWRLYCDLRAHSSKQDDSQAEQPQEKQTSFGQALFQITLADVSMSLDNVLAVAGIARDHVYILVFGLALSVALMLVAATMVAHFLDRYPWVGYIGLAIIVYVACIMVWDGSIDILQRYAPNML